MSIKVMTQIWEHSRQEGSALLLLLAIADHAHDDGTGAWPSIETLSNKTRQTKRNTQLLLRKLEESGELTTQIGEGPHGCNAYIINLSTYGGDEKISPSVKPSAGGMKSTAPGMKTTAKQPRQISSEPSLEPSLEPSRTHTPAPAPDPGKMNSPREDPDFGIAYSAYEAEFGRLNFKERCTFEDLWDEYPVLEAHAHARVAMKRDAKFYNLAFYVSAVRSFTHKHYQKVGENHNGHSNGNEAGAMDPERDIGRERIGGAGGP